MSLHNKPGRPIGSQKFHKDCDPFIMQLVKEINDKGIATHRIAKLVGWESIRNNVYYGKNISLVAVRDFAQYMGYEIVLRKK